MTDAERALKFFGCKREMSFQTGSLEWRHSRACVAKEPTGDGWGCESLASEFSAVRAEGAERVARLERVRRLMERASPLLLDAALSQSPRTSECHGEKCREDECESCFGDFARSKERTMELKEQIDAALADLDRRNP